MALFFFHRTNGFVDHDADGTDLQDLHAARIQAVVFAAETLRDKPECVWRGQDLRVEVTDDQGTLLLTVITVAIDVTAK